LAVLTVLWPGYAAAHRVTVFAWVEGETVHTESKFSGGKPVNGGEILVYDLDGNPLLSGKTNEQGEFSFKIPKKTGMKIVLQAGMGHRGEWTLPLSEIAPHEPKPEPAVSQETPAGMSEAGVPASSVSLDQIRRVLDQSLDQRLNPVLKMLSESRDKGPTLRDILGGIGYILGLMGLAAYIHFRRKAGEITGKNKG
jgi:nickel transport protein